MLPIIFHYTSIKKYAYEFFIFSVKQARAALFAGTFFILLFVSNHMEIAAIARYDFIFIFSLIPQFAFYYFKLETDEKTHELGEY